MRIIQDKLALLNAQQHHNLKTPCQHEEKCHHCKSPKRMVDYRKIVS